MTPDNIDTEALLNLRADACNIDGRSLMEVLLAQQKYERAIYAAAPALLATVEAQRKEIEGLRGDSEKWRTAARVLCGAHVGLPQSACPVCERDELKAEVELLRMASNAKGYALRSSVAFADADIAALKAEVERLRAALVKAREALIPQSPACWAASEVLGAALRGEEAARE